MKIRTGFVSNSSSSSFVCDICGNIESGYDARPEDVGMTICKNGHTMCESHVDGYTSFKDSLDTPEKLIAYLNENWTGKYYIEQLEKALKQIANAGDDFESVRDEIMEDEEFANGPCETDCPICNMTEISGDVVLAYLYKTRNINLVDIKTEIKSKFKTLKELEDFIKV